MRNRISYGYQAHFKRADFWKVNMSEYDLIVVFGVQEMMKDLASKLKQEMKPDALIVSCRFPISSYKSVFQYDDDLDSSWIYTKQSLEKIVPLREREKLNIKKTEERDDDDDD